MFILFLALIQGAVASPSLRCESLFTKTTSPLSWTQEIDSFVENNKNITLQRPWTSKEQDFFQSIFSHRGELNSLSPRDLVKVFGLFAQLRLMPPPGFAHLLIEAMRNSLYDWRESDIQTFASFRKMTPLELNSSFLTAWETLILLNFEDWQTKTQLEVLSAELYHQRPYSANQWDNLLSQMTEGLAHSHYLLSPKSLKELYRGLMWVNPQKITTRPELAAPLIRQIEIHLQRHALSLQENGRSGSLSPERNIGWPIGRLQILMEHEFPGIEGLTEYSDPTMPGFFDPIDLYYPELRLVIEWDGAQHYWRPLSEKGELLDSYILRPFDVAKDNTLRRQGFLVLRLNSQKNRILETQSVRDLIEQQNPGAALPPETPPRFYLNVEDDENPSHQRGSEIY